MGKMNAFLRKWLENSFLQAKNSFEIKGNEYKLRLFIRNLEGHLQASHYNQIFIKFWRNF